MNLTTESGYVVGRPVTNACFTSEIDLDPRPVLGLPKSPLPSNVFLADEEAESTCLLLTPSPPTDNQLDTTDTVLTDCQPEFPGQNNDPSVMESSSSSSSVLQEQTVCAQLLSSHLYQHLAKSNNVDSFTIQESGGKLPLSGLQMAIRKDPDDFCFLNWNWPLIRKCSLGGYISILVAFLCIVVALMAQLPAVCNPHHGWWQGTTFYEVFTASFQDTNSDGIGDLYGLSVRAPYLNSLGVQAVRLNYIFLSNHYPESYNKVINLTKIDPSLGNIKDFEHTISTLHKQNISVILDLPINQFIDERNYIETSYEVVNKTDPSASPKHESDDAVSYAINYWLERGVDGFYLKGLEDLVDDSKFTFYIKKWRKIVDKFSKPDEEKILMCNVNVLEALKYQEEEKHNVILYRMDLIDIEIDAWLNGTDKLKEQIDSVTRSVLYSKPGYPWVHWHLGSVDTARLSSSMDGRNTSLALTMVQLMLPGTSSIFYGDEIGLQSSHDPHGERRDLSHLHQLSPMQWSKGQFTTLTILPWLYPGEAASRSMQWDALVDIAHLRMLAPPIYMNGVWKDHENLPNTEIRSLKGLIVVERRYPRRNSYVLVANLANHTITTDLSIHYYGGLVMVDLHGRTGQYITFHELTLFPGEGIVVKLDK